MLLPIYLDNNATTPVDPQVLEAMLPHFATRFGNPSNTTHSFGRDAADAVELARGQVATFIGATPREIIFTSGGTESINLAIKGAAWAGKATGHRIITGAAEHDAVLNACRTLEKFGFELVVLPVVAVVFAAAPAAATAAQTAQENQTRR